MQQPKAIILGAARGKRHLDASRSIPNSLEQLGSHGRVLDWMLQAFKTLGVAHSNTFFVGGYHIQKVISHYPELRFFFHPNWQTQGELEALKLARNEITGPVFICNTDVVFRAETLLALRESNADVAVAFPGTPKDKKNPLCLGPIWFSQSGTKTLLEILDTNDTADKDLFWLFSKLEQYNTKLTCVNVSHHCGLLKDKLALSHFVFGTKAMTLERIRPLVKNATVLNQVRFNFAAWQKAKPQVLEEIRHKLSAQKLVVRSSSTHEDNWGHSAAGRFESILDVDSGSTQSIEEAIDKVFSTYPEEQNPRAFALNEVFVQPQIDNVKMSGVMFTRDQESNAPFAIFSVDRSSGRTDTVTSGTTHHTETFVAYRRTKSVPEGHFLTPLLAVMEELEDLIGYDRLDIEFAVDCNDHIYVFQVRPLARAKAEIELEEESLVAEMEQMRAFAQNLMAPHPFLHGTHTMLGNMPDWNPAEMIGTAPRPLALSLYQTLITDRAWAMARAQMGYRDVGEEPLLVSLAGIPYIDLRASFNSFVPAGLDDQTACGLVEIYLQTLAKKPHLHDKIEFEVAVTCLALDFDHHAKRLQKAGLGTKQTEELKNTLRHLTQSFIQGKTAPIQASLDKIKQLGIGRQKLLSTPPTAKTIPAMVLRLATDCVNFGTIPFSILARHGFVAVTLLKSLKSESILTQEEYNLVLKSIPTVAADISQAIEKLGKGQISRDDFTNQYGHLRPGTYDILSPNYKALIDSLEKAGKTNTARKNQHAKTNADTARDIFAKKHDQIGAALEKQGFSCTVEELLDYVMAAIPAREWAKFEFTKSVNAILELTADFCAAYGLDRNSASFLSIETIKRFATNSPSCAAGFELERLAGFAQKKYELTKSIRLPQLIKNATDMVFFQMEQSRPNFITDTKLVAEVCHIDNNRPSPEELKGKIVLIRGADPGYDWIFSCSVAGLVTQFGGAASHMAIRAAEFGLPSAIGCGESIFEEVKHAARIELDCANQQVKVL